MKVMIDYRIAFFTADWNYELVEKTLQGLRQFVDEHDNVSIRVFDCFGKDLGNANDRSEYAIFDLADLRRFDGLLIQGSQIVLEPMRQAISRRVLATGIPAMSIDCPIEGCGLVSIDNHCAQYGITEHVIRAHGARRLVYLTGIMDNGCPEGAQRRDGFLDACRDNGIAPEDMEIITCTWRTGDGAAVAERWLAEARPLPDAFVCANDEMALGLMEVLEDHGFAIPRDVIVVGFDNVSSAELSSPRLSTVNRDYERLMHAAMEALIRRIDGTETKSFIPFEHQLVCSESCGCHISAQPGYIRNRYFQQTRFLKNFYILQDEMAESLLEADDLPGLMTIVEHNHRIFGCDNSYLCINDYYHDNYEKKHWQHDSEAFGDQVVLAACGETVRSGDSRHRHDRFPTDQLLPEAITERERFLVFYPLHYNTYSIGYIAMNGISEAAKLNLHKSIFNFLAIAIENVRKKCLLRQLNDELGNLYVRDSLTQLYNRFGYERYARQTYQSLLDSDGSAQVLFIDMDDMKTINDRYGHEMGDLAINTTADILKDTCAAGSFIMRYGGDEFLVVATGQAHTLEADIQRAVEQTRQREDIPFELSLSVGIVRAERAEGRTLDACVQEADAMMYERKNRRKHR